MVLELRKAQSRDFPALQQMLELYQYELSDIWPQEADSQAKYGYDLERHRRGERFHAHVALDGHQYVGFALVAPAAVTRKEGSWMEQFFILKHYRRSGAGFALAMHVFRSHPGPLGGRPDALQPGCTGVLASRHRDSNLGRLH